MTVFDQTALSLLGVLGAASLKATLVLATGVGAAWLLRRRSAALKHAVLTTALGASVAMLVLPFVIPAWRVIPVPLETASVAVRTDAVMSPSSDETVKPRGEDRTAMPDLPDVHHSPVVAPWRISARRMAAHWPMVALAVWLVGAILVLARHLSSVVTLHRLCGRARVLSDTGAARLGGRLADEVQIARPVTFLSSDELELPLTWGLIRPRVVLPTHAEEWDADRLQHVLEHELAHVKRLDAGTQIIAAWACAAFWFHPLVWWATQHMHHERERACDDRVLTRGVARSAYAAELLTLIDVYGQANRHDAALAMTGGSALERRILALLDPAIDRGTASRTHLAAALVVATLVALPVAAVGETAASVAEPASTITAASAHPQAAAVLDHASVGVAHRASPPATHQPRARHRQVADLFEGCRPMGSHLHGGTDPVDGRPLWMVSAVGADCRADFTVHGSVAFSQDVTAIDSISDGGDVAITVSLPGGTTGLEARATGAGMIAYTFTRDGAAVDFDGDGRAWLASFLTALDRRTAFVLDERLPALLNTGGASQVLDEIDLLGTEYARTRYLTALAERTVLTQHELNRALGVIGQLTVDQDRLRSLIALARGTRIEGPSLETYLNAAVALDTASSRRRAVEALRYH